MGKKKKKLIIKARRIRFDLATVLPPTDPLSVSLLRLLMAVNDARHIQKLLIFANDAKPKEGSFAQPVASGEILHLFRLLCGHLCEAGIAFRSIKPDLFDKAVPLDDEEGLQQLEYLRRSFSTDGGDALHYAYLKPIRDNMGFHYKMEPLKAALERHIADNDLNGTLIIAEFLGLSRYCIGDHLANSEVRDILGATLETYQEAFLSRMGEVIRLAGALSYVVDLFLLNVMESRPGSVIESTAGDMLVPAAVSRARRRQADHSQNHQPPDTAPRRA